MNKFKCTAIDDKGEYGYRVRFDPETGPGRIQLFMDEAETKQFEVGKIYTLNFKEVKKKG